MIFWIGQKVVCVGVDDIDEDTGEMVVHPGVGMVCEVDFVDASGYIGLKGYDSDICFRAGNFREEGYDWEFVEEVLRFLAK